MAALSGERASHPVWVGALGYTVKGKGQWTTLSWAQFDSRSQSREKAGFLSVHLSKIDHEEKRVMTEEKDLRKGLNLGN